MSNAPAVAVGYYWGDDGYGVEHAPEALAARVAGPGGEPLERWHVTGGATTAAQIAERVATAPLFGGGTLAVVAEPAPLVRSKSEKESLFAALRAVAPGNALAFVELIDGSGRRPTSLDALRAEVDEIGGEVRNLAAPTRDGMARWIEDRARERGISLARGAAAVLAERIGAFVREGDVDRRRQGILAVGELEKLAVYRDGAEIDPDDVRALVPDAVPGSMWALLDAIAYRRTSEAAAISERLLEAATPAPVIVSQLHRRIRELVEVADLLAAGASPGSLVRTLKLKPFRAEKLAEQARAWTLPELEAALEGLLLLDATIKGADQGGASPAGGGGETRRRLALTLWLAENVARGAAPAAR